MLGCGIDIGNGKFKVTPDGTVHMTGDIVWGDNEPTGNETLVLYGRDMYATPSGVYDSYPTSSSTSWHKTFNSTYDTYASYSYDSGLTWGPAVMIRGVT